MACPRIFVLLQTPLATVYEIFVFENAGTANDLGVSKAATTKEAQGCGRSLSKSS